MQPSRIVLRIQRLDGAFRIELTEPGSEQLNFLIFLNQNWIIHESFVVPNSDVSLDL